MSVLPRFISRAGLSHEQQPSLPVRVAGGCYGAGAWLHRALYARGLLQRRQLSCRVVSVGSLAVGGAGKTPTAAWLAARLRERGYTVVLASRGYGRTRKEPVTVVSDGRRLRSDPAHAGDEPLVLAAHAPGVPVLVGRDRARVGLRAVSVFDPDVLVLDDGFQHHRLQRDIEILTFDAELGLGNGHPLPAGPLREWPSALARADAVGVLDGSLAARDESLITRYAGRAQRYRAVRRPSGLRALAGGRVLPPDSLHGMKVGLLTGVARPESMTRTLSTLGATLVAKRFLPDHHRYRPSDLLGLADQAGVWITSEKDAVKILPSWLAGLDLRVLGIELEVDAPDALLDWLEVRLRGPRFRGSSERQSASARQQLAP